jgi:hypothetical protein
MNERKWLGGIIKDENGNLIHVRDEEAYDLGTLLQYSECQPKIDHL